MCGIEFEQWLTSNNFLIAEAGLARDIFCHVRFKEKRKQISTTGEIFVASRCFDSGLAIK
jgi:hypothetical protein